MKYSTYSAIVIGSGISGLYSALKIEQQLDLPNGILLITKSKLGESNSYYAQGGMVAVLKDNKEDSVQLHVSDTIKAGAGLSDVKTVQFISENSDKVVRDLLTFGVDFDKDEDGQFTLTKEAAHSVNRILHSGGDATGREVEVALCNAVKANKNIQIAENTMAVELLVKDNVCNGVITYNEDENEYEMISSGAVILATGGLGQLYKYTTNPKGATGDGFALCYNAGVTLQDMEFVQFHPTALAQEAFNRFLITEALRGEGAKLCDALGNEFMENYHPKKELAPRDIVARSICEEMDKTNQPNVYLNATAIDSELLLKRFPTVAKVCAKHGIDITKDYIPVAPAAHYFMGGVKTNLKTETSVENLYAIGEVASTGLHGGNRLASNSLLECVVCAYEVAKVLKTKNLSSNANIEDYAGIILKYEQETKPCEFVETLKNTLKDTMWENVGIFRTQESLKKALEVIALLKVRFRKANRCENISEYEFRNMLSTAELIVSSAMNRQESRGAHYRLDFKEPKSVCEHSLINKNNK